jgi:CheY-like chemotaxis protein
MTRRRILCIGKDSGVLRSRCDLLESAGFTAESFIYPEGIARLQEEQFDLILLSAILTEEERSEIQTLIGTTAPVLVVPKTIMASSLLAEIDLAFAPASRPKRR